MFFIAIIGAVFIGCSSDDDISKKEYDSSLFGELKCFTVDDKYIYIDAVAMNTTVMSRPFILIGNIIMRNNFL